MEEKKRFEELINKFNSESEIKNGIPFSDDEIKFMAKYNLKDFSEKYPSIAEYYIRILSD